VQLAMPQPSFSRATAIQSLRTHEGIESLRSNLREEHMLKMDWVSRDPGARSQLLCLVCSAFDWSAVLTGFCSMLLQAVSEALMSILWVFVHR
jgi:hypothetical protein